MSRYSRSISFQPVGREGQERLSSARIAIVGCGALGSVLADILARSGVGYIRIIDRDFVELDNLQRQVLFDEEDAAQRRPKAEAARRKLSCVNSEISIEGIIEDVNATNIEALTSNVDLILDGTDNFATRYLINDLAVKEGIPWIYGACVAATGLSLAVLPKQYISRAVQGTLKTSAQQTGDIRPITSETLQPTACLRCVFDQPPPPELSPTCDTAGVLGPVVQIVAGWQAAQAIKVLTANFDALDRKLMCLDLWSNRVTHVSADHSTDCLCCQQAHYEYLLREVEQNAAMLCGRNAVQINPVTTTAARTIDLAELQRKLSAIAQADVQRSEFLVQAKIKDHELIVFPTGRAIIKGTRSIAEARSIYSKYIGD